MSAIGSPSPGEENGSVPAESGPLSRVMTVDDWDLLLTDDDSGRHVTLHPTQPERFWADPFLIPGPNDGPPTLLCEEFDHKTDLGTVVELSLDEHLQVERVTPILGTGRHESYPFTFELDGDFYCIPETAQLGSVLLYRRHEAGWLHEATMLPDFAGLDSTLVVDPDGVFWLFTSPLSAPDELHLWSTTELTGRWQPHRLNPVVSSARGGRSAGRIRWEDGVLIRPGQDSSQRYGGAIVEFEIGELSSEAYGEAERTERRPPMGYVGTHTIDRVGSFTVIDAVKRTSIMSNRNFVQWRLRKTARQLTGRRP